MKLLDLKALISTIFLVATVENFEIIIVICGGKPNRGIGLKVYHSQVDDAFCFELYKTLEQKTKPLGMVVIGRNSLRNKYLGNHVGCLPAHCSQFINRYGIPPLPENDKSFMLNLSILLSSPGTLQEAAKKFRQINLIKIDNVQVMDAKTSTFNNIAEINLPQAIIKSLVFYQSCSRHSGNILFKIQLSSDTLYSYVDLTETVHKLSHDAYLKRQSSEESKVPEFVFSCAHLACIVTPSGLIDIVDLPLSFCICTS